MTLLPPPSRCPAGQCQPAFSLIELLLTLAILITLTTLMWSRRSGNYQRTQMQLCQDNLQKCHVALTIYASDHDGKMCESPGATTSEEPLSLLVPRYSADTTIFICPGSKDAPLPSGEPFAKRKISYAYYMGGAAPAWMSDRQVDTRSKLPGQPLFSATGLPPGDNHHKFGGNVLFADGHVAESPPQSAFSLVLTNGVVLLNPKP